MRRLNIGLFSVLETIYIPVECGSCFQLYFKLDLTITYKRNVKLFPPIPINL